MTVGVAGWIRFLCISYRNTVELSLKVSQKWQNIRGAVSFISFCGGFNWVKTLPCIVVSVSCPSRGAEMQKKKLPVAIPRHHVIA